MLHRFLLAFFLSVAPYGFLSAANAATIAVNTIDDELNTDGDCSLREAITSANLDVAQDACTAGSGADTVAIQGGFYNLDVVGPGEDDNATGDLDIRTSMTLTGVGGSVILSGDFSGPGQQDRVLHIRCNDTLLADIDVTVDGLLIQTGKASSGEPGGGIWIEDCGGPQGGESHVTVDNSTFVVNLADDGGGAIADETGGFVTIRDSFFLGNGMLGGTPSTTRGGGAILVDGGGLTTIEDSLFTANSVPSGIGMSGSAVYVSGPTNFRRSTLWENSGPGGTLACRNATMNLDNTTISDNTGIGAQAGAAGAEPCTLSISSSTILGNSGTGLLNEAGIITLDNTIVAKNAGLAPSVDVDGAYTTTGHNLVGNMDGGSGIPDPSDLFGTAGAEIDPLLLPLDVNGNPPANVPTYSSPARNTGDSAFAIDGRGNPRPIGGQDDRGAVEFQNGDLDWGIYLDVGNGITPSDFYAAAADVAGHWNGSGIVTALPVDDLNGQPTNITVDVRSEFENVTMSPPLPDGERLFRDFVADCNNPERWNISFYDLPNATYDVYVYAPFPATLYSGDVSVGGVPVASFPGDALTPINGVSYRKETVSVTGGTLHTSGIDTINFDCVGVSGIQLVPEPGRGIGLASSALLLFALASTHRTRKVERQGGTTR